MCAANPFPELYAAVMFYTWAVVVELIYHNVTQ